MSDVRYSYLPNYTYEDYKNWEGKWELMNGIPYAKVPSPGYVHQKVCGKIMFQLSELLESITNYIPLLPVDWRIPDGADNNVIQPDIIVVNADVQGDFLTDTPKIVFEILSQSTVLKDRHIKYDIYESNRVKYYIIVDPDNQIADVFELQNGSYKKVTEARNEIVKFDLDKDCLIEFNFEKIWV